MAFAYLLLNFSAYCHHIGVLEEKGRPGATFSNSGAGFRLGRLSPVFFPVGLQLRRSEIVCHGRLKVMESQSVENEQIRSTVAIPVSCYQIVGVPAHAEKDEIVKSVLELKNTEIEEGYTLDAVESRQDLLMDVRDKLLFEPEYAGNAREKVPPKSSLCIPWAWLPGAMCLLQEAGEAKLVLEIGRAAQQHSDSKPYIHDLLLSMALAECSIAKTGFENCKVSQGFEALARAQYLLRSKISLGKMPLLTQIEESLEELAPSCTLELLSMPHTPENAERRRGAIAALRELLRQGLEVETSSRVQDWPCFFSQAMSRLMATEIVDLLPWDTLAFTRKNKKSLESQNQRVVIDFNCFYNVMLAHIALGFSSKQMDLIGRSKNICECLEASDSINLKFEEALCSFLLGQGFEKVAVERLRQLDISGSSPSQSPKPTVSDKEDRDSASIYPSLEKWLKDAVLGVFPDTRDCSPSLANFFGGDKRNLISKQKKGASQTVRPSTSVPQLGNRNGDSEDSLLVSPTRHIVAAVKQLSPANLQNELTASDTVGTTSFPSVKMKRSFRAHHSKVWESLWASSDLAGKITVATLTGCFVFLTLKLLYMKFGQRQSPCKWYSTQSKLAVSHCSDNKTAPACIANNSITGRLGKLFIPLKKQVKHLMSAGCRQDTWPVDDHLSPFDKFRAGAGNVPHRRQMPLDEAEALVKQWQSIKAEALGPNHQVHRLPKVLAESMLSQWQDLADSAKSRSCFWRFVLLQLSVLRADIVSDGTGWEMAEIDTVLEEAAELVDESQPNNPNYYSTYQIRYILKRQFDGSWRFCGGGIQTPT